METPTASAPDLEKETLKVRQKLWMLSAIIGPLSIAVKNKGRESVKTAQIEIEAGKALFEEGLLPLAREKADESFQLVSLTVEFLPKTARKLIHKKLKEIGKY